MHEPEHKCTRQVRQYRSVAPDMKPDARNTTQRTDKGTSPFPPQYCIYILFPAAATLFPFIFYIMPECVPEQPCTYPLVN